MRFEGKTAVVTGGSRGIGAAICRQFAREGANTVFLYARNDKAAQELMEQITKSGGKARSYKVLVEDFSAVQRTFSEILEEFGGIDILVNNAGILRDGLLALMSEETWDDVISVNLKGCFNCSRAVIKNMIMRKRGKIINISSIAGIIGGRGKTNYAASKGAMISFTKSLSQEVARLGICVNAVAPGLIVTDMAAESDWNTLQKFGKKISMNRPGAPEEISEVVAFLASDDASYICGQVIAVDGGII